MLEMKMIRIPLSNEEIQQRGEAVCRLMAEAATRKQALKDSQAEEKKEIRALENEAWALAKEVREQARWEPAQMSMRGAA